jgi:hypothetical protein
MGFFVASADASGALIASSSELLAPGPADVDYPQQPAGRIVDTASGTRIKQLPPRDARPRAWVWNDLPSYRPSYVRFVQRLESLLGTTRLERGLSPYIYLKDTVSAEFRLWKFEAGTASSVSSSTLTDSTKAWAVNAFANGTVEIVSGTGAGQRRSILSNTATQLTVSAWDTPPTGAAYSILYQDSTWVRVRVLNVSKRVVAKRALSWDTIRLEFVIDDPAWNALG